MQYNYHTHTILCSHATGSMEDYVKRAIYGGITNMGFSEHIPFICSDGYESSYRVPVKRQEEYIKKAFALKEKYKDKIDIKVGFEMEYYPQQFKMMFKKALSLGAEYLILGEHFTREESPNGFYVLSNYNTEENLKEYTSCVTEAIKCGVFTYVAHPDIFKFTGDGDVYKSEMRKICVAAREFNTPLEINFLGIRQGRNYPNDIFWQIAGEEKSPVTFGFDAHTAEDAFDNKSLITAENMVKKYNLNYIGMPKIIAIEKNGAK